MTSLEEYATTLEEKCKGSKGHKFFKTLVLTYLRTGITPAPKDLHGPEEKGKDIFFSINLPLDLGELHCAAIVHNTPINARIRSRDAIERVMDQVDRAFENHVDVGGTEGPSLKYIDVALIFAPTITASAKDEIRTKVKIGTRNVIFIDGLELIEKMQKREPELLKQFLGDE